MRTVRVAGRRASSAPAYGTPPRGLRSTVLPGGGKYACAGRPRREHTRGMSRATVVGHEGSRSVVLAGWGAAAASVLVVYLAVVLGGGALMGRTESPSLPLSILATALVAGVAPLVRARAEQARAQKLGDTTSPYDVLADFSRVAGSDAGDRAPALIARMLVQGLALEWAQVWVLVGDELRLLATHPPEAVVDEAAPRLYDDRRRGGIHAVTVAHAGRPLGVVRVMGRQDRPPGPHRGTAAGRARRPGGHGAGVGAAARGAGPARAGAHRPGARAAPGARGARHRPGPGASPAGAGHPRRRPAAARRARDQPQAGRGARRDRPGACSGGAAGAAGSDRQRDTDADRPRRAALLPATLAQEGLAAALSEATAANPVPVLVRGGDVPRLPGAVEATLYFCALEAVQNATKHADSTRIDLMLESGPAGVSVAVEDNGSGIAPGAHQGSGLANLSRARRVGRRPPRGG